VVELNTVVQSAGGVVWRTTADGGLEIALVHRPRYDDWSLPKGKLDADEHQLDAAVREVFEETAVRGVPQARLPTIRYLTGQPGVEKVVHFWSMRADTWSDRAPDDEIEEVRWIAPGAAAGLLSYAHDRGVVKAFLDLPPVTAVIALVRHAKAGKRTQWSGPDDLRPLEPAGFTDADALCRLLELFRPTLVISAEPLRCQQTVRPLGLPIAADPVFNKDADAGAAAAALRSLASEGGVPVVCSQGELIPAVLGELTGRGIPQFSTPKGAAWILSFNGARLVGYDFLQP
jgi:8-oxo-dGTP pyrophosphatase MutT (NUDIX family)/phosphohistidine phosphatase SixA